MLTLEAHLDGRWEKIATVEIAEASLGIRGASQTIYESDYVLDRVVAGGEMHAIDRRALSVRTPASLEDVYLRHWPSWLLDLMPQGVARERIAEQAGMARNAPELDMELLLRAGGSPVGNLRIQEARGLERDRLDGVTCPPLTDQDITSRTEAFEDVVNRFALLASGSSGVQGEWPKALLTKSGRDNSWYPDPFVPTEEGVEHVIVKLLRSGRDADRLILASEAPYMEIAGQFGLDVHAPPVYENGVLIVPRFDREIRDGSVLLHGQESMVSALGVAEFGHVTAHERYLEVIREFSDDPPADTLEYVLRDVLNMAMGNPDNHGRNTALRKHADGGVRLAPLFDFAPMRLSDAGIGRSTRWECLGGSDRNGHWGRVAQAASFAGLPSETIRDAMQSKVPMLRDLGRIAREAGVQDEVVDRAIDGGRVADAIERMD